MCAKFSRLSFFQTFFYCKIPNKVFLMHISETQIMGLYFNNVNGNMFLLELTSTGYFKLIANKPIW